MDLDTIINDAIYELTDEAFTKLRETDDEFDSAILRNVELSDAVKEIIDSLPDDKRKIVEEYVSLKEISDGKEIIESYKQGARDCVTILKKLGVI